jgi:nucleotide sugar dehydrogenase
MRKGMRVSIIGSGVTGKATGGGLIKHGHKVLFCDSNPAVRSAMEGEGYQVADIPEAVAKSDIHMICVPTPLRDNTLDMQFLEEAIRNVAAAMVKKDGYQVIVVRSTVFPLTTRHRLIPIAQKSSRLDIGSEYGVCCNPEFLRSAHALNDFLNPPIIIIGEADSRGGDMLASLYHSFPASIFRTTLENAEAIKCFSNVYNAMKVSFFNLLYLLGEPAHLDHEKVEEAMLKASLGIRIPEYYTRGGYPFGGECLPKDLAAATTFLREHGINVRLLEAVAEINQIMAQREKKS